MTKDERQHYLALARLHLRHARLQRADRFRTHARWHLAQAGNARRFAMAAAARRAALGAGGQA